MPVRGDRTVQPVSFPSLTPSMVYVNAESHALCKRGDVFTHLSAPKMCTAPSWNVEIDILVSSAVLVTGVPMRSRVARTPKRAVQMPFIFSFGLRRGAR